MTNWKKGMLFNVWMAGIMSYKEFLYKYINENPLTKYKDECVYLYK